MAWGSRLDDALARFEPTSLEYGPGLANHGPMAAEALCALGHPALVDDRERGVQPLSDGPRAGHSPDVGRDDDEVLDAQLADRVEQDGRGEEVVDRDVEEALDLERVQVHRQDPVGARRGQEVGHQLGGDGDARLVLLVLPRVAEVRHHRGDARRRGAPERVEQDQELHHVVVDRRARRLNHEDVGAPDVLVDLAVVLAVGEVVERELAQGEIPGSRRSPARARGARGPRRSSGHRRRSLESSAGDSTRGRADRAATAIFAAREVSRGNRGRRRAPRERERAKGAGERSSRVWRAARRCGTQPPKRTRRRESGAGGLEPPDAGSKGRCLTNLATPQSCSRRRG